MNRRRPFRLAVIDRDDEILAALSKREIKRWQLLPLESPVPPEELVGMRLSALLLDPAALGDQGQVYLEEVCTRLPDLAIVVFTARSTLSERVRGLRFGADDWITKPCHLEELVSRIEAVSRRRRSQENIGPEPILAGEITLFPDQYQAFIANQSVGLTKREFELLCLFAEKRGQVLERETIYRRVWGYAMAHGDRSVDVFVRKLRLKLAEVAGKRDFIHTHFGIGYRFDPDLAGVAPIGPNPSDTKPIDAATRQLAMPRGSLPGGS